MTENHDSTSFINHQNKKILNTILGDEIQQLFFFKAFFFSCTYFVIAHVSFHFFIIIYFIFFGCVGSSFLCEGFL